MGRVQDRVAVVTGAVQGQLLDFGGEGPFHRVRFVP